MAQGHTCAFGCGGWTRTTDLWVMSPTSYQLLLLRHCYWLLREKISPFSFGPQTASFHQVVTRRIVDRHRYGYPQIPAGIWLGWQDLNLRMPESKSGALPLGDIPI